MIDLNTIYVQSTDIVVREIEGELIIIPIAAGIADMEEDLFSLNDAGKAIWDKLDGTRSAVQIVDLLEEEFEGERRLFEEDVEGFLNELLQRGIIVAL
jgi:hypothetical protein